MRLSEADHSVGVCHCRTCRRWTSGPWLSLQSPAAVVEGDGLAVYRSSAFAERGFCRRCGAHIFHRPRMGPELAVSAGLFDDRQQRIDREIFHDAKPPHYRFVADSERRSTASMIWEWAPRLLARSLARLFVR